MAEGLMTVHWQTQHGMDTGGIIVRICNKVKNSHEGRGPVHDIYVRAKGVQRLVQGHMPGDPGGVQHGTLGLPHPSGVLGKSSDGGSRRGYYGFGV